MRELGGQEPPMGAAELRRGWRGAAVRGLRWHRGADVGGGERISKAALTRFRPLLAPAAWPEGGGDRQPNPSEGKAWSLCCCSIPASSGRRTVWRRTERKSGVVEEEERRGREQNGRQGRPNGTEVSCQECHLNLGPVQFGKTGEKLPYHILLLFDK